MQYIQHIIDKDIPLVSELKLKWKCLIPILIPEPKSLVPIPIPGVFQMFDSDSDSSQKCNDSGIDSDSGIGILHHWDSLTLANRLHLFYNTLSLPGSPLSSPDCLCVMPIGSIGIF